MFLNKLFRYFDVMFNQNQIIMKTEQSFTEAYTKYYGLVLNYLKGRFNLSTAEAEDFTQETFEKAYKNFDRQPGGFDPKKGALPQWLCSVGWQIVTDHFRTSRSKRLESIDNVDFTNNQSADENIIEAETQMALRSALMKLSYKNRMVAVLRLVNDKSTKEIAEIMDIPLNSVLVTIQRVKVQLKGVLEPQGYHA